MKATLLILCLAAAASGAHAERADRQKPANLEADRVSVDDAKKVQVFDGNVQLTQGTMLIRTDHLVVTQDASGLQSGVATGGPGGVAYFRQKREGRDEFIEGEAERIEHDERSERTEFFGRAVVRSGEDELRGNYIVYDAKTENYLVTSAPAVAGVPTGSDGRVHAVIQPKDKDAAVAPAPPPAKAADGAALKVAPEVTPPRPAANP
jgi:lipopolysaccharide export system protein LptA